MLAELVRNNFINDRVTVNSRERLSRTNTRQASVLYNNTGKHFSIDQTNNNFLSIISLDSFVFFALHRYYCNASAFVIRVLNDYLLTGLLIYLLITLPATVWVVLSCLQPCSLRVSTTLWNVQLWCHRWIVSVESNIDTTEKFVPFVPLCTCCAWAYTGRLKMREWKMRYGQNCKGGKCRSGKTGVDSRGGKCRSKLYMKHQRAYISTESYISWS